MRTGTENAHFSKNVLWTGRAVSGLVVLFLIVDGVIKLIPIEPVAETMTQLGWPASPAMTRGLGILTVVCSALYAFPPTSVFGAILLTGYLGGAIVTHLHAGADLQPPSLPTPSRVND